ncbi:hypothetical protein [Actinomadura bangladeshensis]|uniref:Uncharacterized protein n=1 Tax=Actinomadura bangladeshensis TaxID=453573 RepID=A0A4R4P4D3_9ACTN|nr:hypothetical protein [Actinomadura bangladeshensis]TDC17248.1 hypothetical protein E1284_09860 [Actinomadura bangladeshensis]
MSRQNDIENPLEGSGALVPTPPAEGERRGRLLRRGLVYGSVICLLLVLSAAGILTAPEPDRPGPSEDRLILDGRAVRAGRPSPDRVVTSRPVSISKSAPENRCSQSARGWTKSAGTDDLLVVIDRCTPFAWAAYVQHLMLDGARENSRVQLRSLPGMHGATMVQVVLAAPERLSSVRAYTSVLWRKGQYVARVRTGSRSSTPPPLTPDVMRLVHEQNAKLPGTPGPGLRSVDTSADSAFLRSTERWIVPGALFFYAVASLIGWGRDRSARQRADGWPPSLPGVRAVEVTQRARRLATGSGIQRWIVTVFFFATFATVANNILLGVVLSVLGSYGLKLGRLYRPGREDVWGRQAQAKLLTGKRSSQAMGLAIAAALLLAVSMIGLLIIPPLVVQFARAGYVESFWRWNPVIVADSGGLERLVRVVPVPITLGWLAVAAFALFQVNEWSFLAARRRSTLTVEERQNRDPRPPIVYLRNFADDRLTIRTAPLTRLSFLEKLSLRQRESFEEVIVRYLQAYGPVIAVSDPDRPSTVLGAAHVVLPHDGWKKTVAGYIERSALVVVGATPIGATDGLHFELGTIARSGALDRTLLLLAPRGLAERLRGWRRFRRSAAAFGIPEQLEDQAGRLLVVRHGADGWTAYHADRRTDWSYAVALAQSADDILLPQAGGQR